MIYSQDCIALITRFEGFFARAYEDPVGILTIGYGTIRYPDGRRVALNDEISEDEARSYLMHECDGIARQVEKLVTRLSELKQNQFDALVSFCYNLGVGALAHSTLLQKFNAGDPSGAAAEFVKWDKAKVHGIKQSLPGLTRRRKAETDLFNKGGTGGQPAGTNESSAANADRLEAYWDAVGKNNVIVAWEGAKVAELLVLPSAGLPSRPLPGSIPDHLIAALRQYPNAKSFAIAPAGTPIPAGPTGSAPIRFSPRGTDVGAAPPPAFPTGLVLSRGADLIGSNPLINTAVSQMQERLKELGYYEGPIDGDFERATDAAVRTFQAAVFGVAEADGRVGPITWNALWGQTSTSARGIATTSPVSSRREYLRLTKTNRRDEFGCVELELAYFKGGAFQESIPARSGIPSRQSFRIGADSIAGSNEPLPEGRWSIGKIEWRDGKDNFQGNVWNSGLGPVKIRLDYEEPGETARGAIEVHIDWNSRRSPGTSGCIGIRNVPDFKRLLVWLRDTDPNVLFVDWGLGTCPR